MRSLFQYVEAIAPTAKPVLIEGETGVGKKLVARAVHELSGRQGRWVAVNVAGLDDNLFSDTLFGHLKGAFTGANQRRGGLVEQAADGTLFLDEIGDLSPASQVKLLRLLQEAQYFPLGADVPKSACPASWCLPIRTSKPSRKQGDPGRTCSIVSRPIGCTSRPYANGRMTCSY